MSRPMMRLLLPWLCIAAAQPNVPIPILPQGEQQFRPVDPAEAERAMDRYARCIVARRSLGQAVSRYLRQLPGDPGFTVESSPQDPDCVPVRGATMRLNFRHDLYRLALFSALYRRDFAATPPPPALASLPPLRLSQEFDRDPTTIPDDIRGFRAFGDCAARADSGAVHRLLLTRIGGDEEGEALRQVMPALANCLPAERQLRFSRGILRGILGEALYKLRVAATAPAPTG